MSKSNYSVVKPNIAILSSEELGKGILRLVICIAAGLLTAKAEVFGSCFPFAIAAVAAAPAEDGIFVLFGAVVGYLMPGGSNYAFGYIAAACAAFVLKWLLSGFVEIKNHPAVSPLIGAASAAVIGLTVVIANGVVAYDVMLRLSETMLAGCAAYFMQKAFPIMKKPAGMWGLTQHDLVGVVITYCILLLPLSNISLGGISPGRIIGVVSILIAARYGRETGGSITGIAVGIVMGLSDKNMAHVLAGYGLGGLIAGVFAPLGRFGCTVAFILANGVAGIYLASAQQAAAGFYEVMAATVIFMLLPEHLLCKISALFVAVPEDALSRKVKDDVSQKLFSAAGAFQEVSGILTELSGKLSKLKKSGGDDVSEVCGQVSENVCSRCGMRMYCWETAYNDTMGALNDMAVLLRQKQNLEREDVPSHFSSRCCKMGDLLYAVNKGYSQYTVRKGMRRENQMLRGLLADEFGSLSAVLNDLGGEFSESTRAEFYGVERIRDAFSSIGIPVEDTFCRIDGKGRLAIEAVVSRSKKIKLDRSQLLENLSSACGRRLEGPEVLGGGGVLRLIFTQKPEFSVRFGQSFLRKDGESLCGDAGESFLDAAGRAFMVLSDGMGCGGDAAVDSNLAVRLMCRLLKSGFSIHSAADVVNSALMLKSDDESFATLDIAEVDLFTGETEFYKAGACPTYVRRGGRAERISQSSMPVGILQHTSLERSGTKLRRGDMVVITSDGVAVSDDSWLIKEIELFDGESPESFADRIAKQARAERSDGHDDDITVMVAQIR